MVGIPLFARRSGGPGQIRTLRRVRARDRLIPRKADARRESIHGRLGALHQNGRLPKKDRGSLRISHSREAIKSRVLARTTYRYASSGILNSAPSFSNCSWNI